MTRRGLKNTRLNHGPPPSDLEQHGPCGLRKNANCASASPKEPERCRKRHLHSETSAASKGRADHQSTVKCFLQPSNFDSGSVKLTRLPKGQPAAPGERTARRAMAQFHLTHSYFTESPDLSPS